MKQWFENFWNRIKEKVYISLGCVACILAFFIVGWICCLIFYFFYWLWSFDFVKNTLTNFGNYIYNNPLIIIYVIIACLAVFCFSKFCIWLYRYLNVNYDAHLLKIIDNYPYAKKFLLNPDSDICSKENIRSYKRFFNNLYKNDFEYIERVLRWKELSKQNDSLKFPYKDIGRQSFINNTMKYFRITLFFSFVLLFITLLCYIFDWTSIKPHILVHTMIVFTIIFVISFSTIFIFNIAVLLKIVKLAKFFPFAIQFLLKKDSKQIASELFISLSDRYDKFFYINIGYLFKLNTIISTLGDFYNIRLSKDEENIVDIKPTKVVVFDSNNHRIEANHEVITKFKDNYLFFKDKKFITYFILVALFLPTAICFYPAFFRYNYVKNAILEFKYNQKISEYNGYCRNLYEKEVIDLYVSVSNELISNNNVGHEWGTSNSFNSIDIGRQRKVISFNVGDPIVLFTQIIEYDGWNDVSYNYNNIEYTKQELINGFSVDIDSYVYENRGTYSGCCAHWISTYKIEAVKPLFPQRYHVNVSFAKVCDNFFSLDDKYK